MNQLTVAMLFVSLITIGVGRCDGRPQQQSSSERLLDLGSIFQRYPAYNQRPFYGGAGGYYPGGGYPNSGGLYPNSGGFYPNSGGLYPNSGYPNGGGYLGGAGYPGGTGLGTNYLGGGGYGGFGGNGGLNSYLGYNNQNYNGQRNLGFGYYRNTDQYGFTPSREGSFYSGTGYRGYN